MPVQDASPAGLGDRWTGRQLSPVFPKTRNSLWDKTSMGQPTILHLGHYRKPRICVPEKILKLVQHQCENYGQGNHVLIGSLVVDADGEGVQVQVDRLDTRTNVSLTGADLAAANVLISFQVTNNAPDERTVPADAYVHALQLLQNRSCSKDSLNLCEFMYLYGCGSFYSNAHSTVAHLDFDLLTFGITFKSTPITPVPVAVTALSKNLATPRNLSSLQGTPKTGYLTMDSTRKVMLLLESDPKCANLPVVGIWVSGVEFLHHPFVWAACLRYIHCTYLQDRARAPPEEFLLVLYRTLQTRPEFYQCATSSGDSGLQFELNTGHETVNMDKMLTSPSSGDFVEVELDLVQDGQKKEIFNAAKLQHSSSVSARDTGVSGQEDLEPRSAPMPHAEKVPVFRPMVPDVSVLWTDSYEHVGSDSPTPGLRNNGFALQKQQVLGFQAELLSKQPGPELNFSRPRFTIPANSQRLDGQYQQTRVPHTRPTLSIQYSPAGQQGAPGFNFQHLQPQDAPTPHIRHNLYVSSDGILSAPTAVPQVYPTDTRNMSPRHVALPGSPHNFTPPTYQTSQPLPPDHMVSPSKMNVARTSSDDRKHLATPLSAHANSHSLPFPDTGNNSYNVQDQNSHNSNCYNSPNPITKVSQHHSQSNNTTSATKGGQQSGILSSEAPTQVHINGHSHHLNSLVHACHASHQPSSSKGLQHYKGALNTINEECLLSPFSQSSLQQQEQPSTRMFEINDREKSAEANGSSLRSSINSSVRSSAEDSGLDATSDRLSISQHGSNSSHPAPAKASACACASPSCAQQNRPESIKWEQVPPEVMTVLMQQSEQLRLLQQQVQMLQSEIARTNSALPLDVVKGDTRHHQKTSVAVNTSFVNDSIAGSQNHYDSKSTQVTPVRHVSRQQDFISPATSYTPKSARSPVEGSQVSAGHNITAAASSAVQMLRQSQQGSSSCAQKDIKQLEFDKDITIIPEFEHTMNLSEPECASFNDRSQLDWSPSGASDYDRQAQESYSTVDGDATDNQQFLSQVMKHINMFLTNGDSQTEEPSSLPAVPEAETTSRVSPSKLDNSAGHSVVPEAGSMIMISGFGTDPSQTGEMNALAMKYLSDEQLATVAQLRQTAPSRSHSSAYSAKILEQVMGGCASSMAGSTSASDLSQFGISPCDMTMGTWNYLQRHGLLGNDRSVVGVSMLEQDLKLRTDFSILTNGSAAGNINLSPSTTVDEAQFLRLDANPEVSSDPVLSPLRLKAPGRANNENWLPAQAGHVGGFNDMGTPPMLAAPDNFASNGAQEYTDRGQYILHGSDRRRNVLQEVRPQVFVNVKTGSNISPLIKACPVEEEEEEENHSLDIEKLRQLPKLL